MKPPHPVTTMSPPGAPVATVTLSCPLCGAACSGAAGPTAEATRLRLWWEGHRCPGRQLVLFEVDA